MEANRALKYLLWDQHEGRRFRNKDDFLRWCRDNSIVENEASDAWETMVMSKTAYPEFEKAIAFDGEGY